MVIVRSILFNILFYLNLVVLLLVALITLVLPRRAVLKMAELWGRVSVWLLRVVCGTRVEFRGLENLPKGALIVAAKHQSTWETFALLRLFDDFTFIVKRELMWIPIFGWCMWKGGMIPVDRGAGSQALTDMTARAKKEIRSGRQLIIFPEGTRRAARRRAALQVRRRPSLRRGRRALRSGRAELRPVLAAPRVPPAARHDRRRVPAADPAGTRQGRVLRSACRATSRRRRRGCSRKGEAELESLGLRAAHRDANSVPRVVVPGNSPELGISKLKKENHGPECSSRNEHG